MGGQPISGKKIDKAHGKFVRDEPAGFEMQCLQRRCGGKDQKRRRGAGQLCHHHENRQHVNEPDRVVRHEEGGRPLGKAFGGTDAAGQNSALGEEQDRHPDKVEIDEVQDLAVEKLPPGPVDALGEEQAGYQEKVRHAEGAGPFDEAVEPAQLTRRFFDAQR